MKEKNSVLKILCSVVVLLFLCTACGLQSDDKKAEKLLDKAVQAIEADNIDDAIIWLQKALQKKSNLAEAHYQLARLYRKQDKPSLAYTELSLALNQNTHFPEAKKELAFFLSEQKAWDEVVKLGEQYTRDEGSDPDIQLLMGNALIALQRADEAVALLRHAVDEYQGNNQLQVTLARALLAADEGEASRRMMEKMAKEHADDINIRLSLSSLYEQLHLNDLCLETLKKIREDFPENPLAHRSLARFLLLTGKPDKAGVVLDEAISAGVETADIHQLRGVIAKTMQQKEIAESHFKKAISLSKGLDRTRSRLLLAEYYISLKQFADAKTLLENLVQDAGNIPMVHYRLIEVYMAQGEFDLARSQVDTLTKEYSGEAFPHLLAGKLLLRDGKLKEARKEFSLAGQLDPRSGESQFLYGLTFMNESEKISLREISKALEKNPDMIQAHLVLAPLFARQGKLEKALAESNLVISKLPDNEKARMFRIRVLLRLGNTKQALQDIDYLVKHYPDNREYRLQQAEIQSIAGNMEKAEALYLAIQKQTPEDEKLLEKLVGLYLRADKSDKALAVVDHYLQQFPHETKVLLVKARVYIAEKKLDEAGKLLDKAVKDDPKNPLPLVMLGNLYRMKNDFAQAAASYEKALLLTPENEAALMNLADVSMQLEDYTRAVSIYEKILKKNSSFLPALNNLLYLYTDKAKNMDRGFEIAKRLAELNPDSSAALDTLGWFYVQQNSHGRAEVYLSRAQEENPEVSIILYHLGMLRYQEKLWKESSALLRQAVEKGDLQADELKNATTVLTKIDSISQQIVQGEMLRTSGKHEQAISFFRRLLDAEGFNADIAIALATTLADLKTDLPTAADLAQQACDVACASDPRALDVMGWVYLQQGTYLLARQYLEQALTVQPESALFRYHHGVLLYKTGSIEEATKELKKAIELNPDTYDRDMALSILQKINQTVR